MKKMFVAIAVFIISISFNTSQAQSRNAGALLRHIVTVTFSKDAVADSIKLLDETYTNLSKNSMVKDFEWGVNISGRDTGVVKHIYMTTFATKDDMDNYKKLPLYKDLFKISASVAADLSVVDYWIKK